MHPGKQVVKPHRNQEFVALMAELIRLFRPHTYVEVGVKNGFTFNVLAPLVERAVAVDINGMGNISDKKGVEKWHMTSAEFGHKWTDPIDLLFIDADHRKEKMLADFLSLAPYVRRGTGLILLHDTHPVQESLLENGYCSNAWEAARHIRLNKGKDFEIVTLPGPWAGLSIVRKIRGHLAWKE